MERNTLLSCLPLVVLALGCVEPTEEDPPATCPEAAPGPSMVMIDTVDGTDYCIDTTEVTQAQYAEFLGDSGTAHVEPPAECSWNTTVEPNAALGTCTEETYDPVTMADRPVVCVDWCDAYAYCDWAGKRLCGHVDGGPLDRTLDGLNHQLSQWFNACSDSGEYTFPYGSDFDLDACNAWDGAYDETVPVASMADCHGSGRLADVFDLSGNVSEWEDACDDQSGAGDYCPMRGGSFHGGTGSGSADCGSGMESVPRNNSGNFSIGFRCCADLPKSYLH